MVYFSILYKTILKCPKCNMHTGKLKIGQVRAGLAQEVFYTIIFTFKAKKKHVCCIGAP